MCYNVNVYILISKHIALSEETQHLNYKMIAQKGSCHCSEGMMSLLDKCLVGTEVFFALLYY